MTAVAGRAGATARRRSTPRDVPDGDRTYSRDEVEEIFRRALERDGDGEPRLDRRELVEAASEAGIDPEAVERAMAELEERSGDEEAVARHVADKRRSFVRSATTFAIVTAGLLGLHYVGQVGDWVYWVAFGWGLLLALKGARAFLPLSEREAERLRARHRRRRRREEARAERRRRKRARRRSRAEREAASEDFEAAVEKGLAAVLSAAARSIERATGPDPPRGEFGRYVARRKGQPRARAEGAPRARVRVEDADGREPAEEELRAEGPDRRRRDR